MHWLDRALTRVNRPASLFFHGGWGDPDLLDFYRSRVYLPPDDFDVEIRWDESFIKGGIVTWDGRYDGPSEHLPPGARAARVRLMMPEGGATRAVLLMPAWNDDGFDGRRAFAARLARRGIASLLPEQPYFGRRRPVAGSLHPVATVADFAIMGQAAVEEGLALLRWLRANGLPDARGLPDPSAPPLTVGVSGYSMGGNIGAFITALAPFPVASAPLASSHSPGPVIARGAISTAVAWEALAGVDDPVEELAAFLGRMSVLNFPALPHTAHAVLVAGRHDGYIPVEAVKALHEHWEGSELRWIGEGHATMMLIRKPTLTDAIEDAFARFELAGAPTTNICRVPDGQSTSSGRAGSRSGP